MQVLERTTESLTVTGLIPSFTMFDDIRVEVTPSPSYPPKHSASSGNYTVAIEGLNPGNSYTIAVETASGVEHSNATEQTFYTRE